MFNSSSCTPLCCPNVWHFQLFFPGYLRCLSRNLFKSKWARFEKDNRTLKIMQVLHLHELRGKHFDFCIFGNAEILFTFKIKQFRPIRYLKLPYHLLGHISIYRFQMGIFPVTGFACNLFDKICINNCIWHEIDHQISAD